MKLSQAIRVTFDSRTIMWYTQKDGKKYKYKYDEHNELLDLISTLNTAKRRGSRYDPVGSDRREKRRGKIVMRRQRREGGIEKNIRMGQPREA